MVALLLFAILVPPGQAATDGSFWDNRFYLAGVRGEVRAIAFSGHTLYVGGAFTSADDVAVTNIAFWDGTNWSALGNGVNGPVNAIVLREQDVFVGGDFTRAGGVSANCVARWDGTNWSAFRLFVLVNLGSAASLPL